MFGVVKGDSVQQEEILFRSSSAYIDSGKSFRSGLYAGHQLYCLQHVRFSEKGWRLLNHGNRHFDSAHFRGFYAGIPGRNHRSSAELEVGIQYEVNDGVFLQADLCVYFGISYV